jgi:bloom syndrome protein
MLQVKVSSTPTAAARPAPRRKAAVPTSTILTSPITPSSRNNKGKGRAQPIQQEDSDEDEDFVVDDAYESSDEDAFEPRNKEPTSAQRRQKRSLGPPITTDDRMDQISDLHRDVVESFVVQAKKFEENLRNRNNHSRRYFSEAQFREMAINWTLSIDMMKDIPDIDHDKVDRYGEKFLPLIETFHRNFEEIMGHTHDRDMDENHQNVIDLCSGDEDEASLNEEEQSRYFVPHDVEQFNQQMALAEQLPQQRRETAPAPKQAFRGGGFKNKKPKSYPAKKYPRKSTGSEGSGPSRAKPVGRAGVSKKAPAPRKGSTTASARRKTSGTGGGLNIMQPFTKNNGSGGGIKMMPL